jgi:hypothetical protein
MHAPHLSPLRMLPMLAVMLSCGGSDVTGPITIGDLAGHYSVTNVSVYFKSDPPFRVNAGGVDGVQVVIEATGVFTVAVTATTGLSPESGRISIAGNVLTVTTDDTGSVFLPSGIEKFGYHDGVLSLVQDDVPQLLGEDVVLTTVTTELTKR